MTRKEWVEKNFPDKVGAKFRNGVEGCPWNYGTMPDGSKAKKACSRTTCERCWNKKIEE